MKKIVFLLLLFTSHIAFADTVIQMEPYGGVFRIPCLVNGAKMKFILDTGASSVCLSMTMAEYLYDNGYITDDDIIGAGTSSVADGRIVDHLKLNLKEITIGDKSLRNIEAIVIQGQSAPLLLGQSALKKLGKYSISGNNLILKSTNQTKNNNNLELSDEEIDELFNEANDSFYDGSYYVALEKYKILYDNDLLSAYGIMHLADCYYSTDNKGTALELYNDIQNEIERDFPNHKTELYFNIGKCYWFLNDFDSAIPFFEKVKLQANIWSNTQSSAVTFLSNIYVEKGNLYKAKSLIDDYILQYLRFMEINATDCWDKLYTDSFLADLYYCQYLNYSSDGTLDSAEKHITIAAAWGNKEAIEYCNKYGINYQIKPRNYVY